MHEAETAPISGQSVIHNHIDPATEVPEAEPEHADIGETTIGVQGAPILRWHKGLPTRDHLKS